MPARARPTWTFWSSRPRRTRRPPNADYLDHAGGRAPRRGSKGGSFTLSPEAVEFSEAWIENDDEARWRSAPGHGPGVGARSSGSSLLEIDAGRRLPRHVDSAEETIVVVAGTADVTAGEGSSRVGPGGIALVPAGLPREVRNAGEDTLRFLAVYAAVEVTTTYEAEVQPGGERERDPLP